MLKNSKFFPLAVVSTTLLALPAFADGGRQGFFASQAEGEFNDIKDRIAEHRFDRLCDFNGFEAVAVYQDKRHVYPCRIASGYIAVHYPAQNVVEIFRAGGDRMVKLRAAVFLSDDNGQLADFDDIRKAFDIAPDR